MASLFNSKDRWLNLFGLASMLVVLIAIYMAFIYAPTDSIQGHAQRIFYIHVPMAWLAYLAYGFILVGSIGFLWKRDFKWDRLARSAAELGFIFTSLVLISGSLWGRPIWGTWWQWEARLTTTLLLWFIYLGYFLVRMLVNEAGGNQERAARYAAVVGIVGAIDLPIIHQSVKWWRTIHPEPVVLDTSGPNLPDSMLATLLVAFLGFTLFFIYLMFLKVRLEYVKDEISERELNKLLAPSRRAESQPVTPVTNVPSEVSGGSED